MRMDNLAGTTHLRYGASVPVHKPVPPACVAGMASQMVPAPGDWGVDGTVAGSTCTCCAHGIANGYGSGWMVCKCYRTWYHVCELRSLYRGSYQLRCR